MNKNKLWMLNVPLFKVEIKFYLALLVIVLVGFWPVSSGFFSLKNDEINYFLPYRYNIVESIRQGHFPLWSPYVYMGFPISGDMQSGAWNPLVWLLALSGRYSLTTLHAELLIYIYFAAVGMFKLMHVLRFEPIVCFTIGISYAFSGFIVDSGQFMSWVSCACFLPFVYIYFIRLLQQPSAAVSAKFALANYLLLIAGGYPFFFIANFYFLAIGFVVFSVNNLRKQQRQTVLTTFKYLALSVFLFLLLGAAPLLNFFDLLPYYARGTQLSLGGALFNSYSLFSTISLLFPFSITREHLNFGNNNVLSRNLYIGIVLLPFVINGIFIKRTLAWNTVLVCLVASFLLSAGEALPFRKWAYWWLPLMNTFRHPSNFRLFITVGLLAFAGKGLNDYFSARPEESRRMITSMFYTIVVIMVALGLYYLPLNEASTFSGFTASSRGLKNMLTNTSFRQAVVLCLVIQIPFVIVAIFWVRKRNYKLVCILSLVNIIFLSQPQLFSSTVGKDPVNKINEFIESQPTGFPAPSLSEPVSLANEQQVFIYAYKEPVRYFFNKKIAINTLITTPTILKTYGRFINDSNLLSTIKNYRFIYLADSNLVQTSNRTKSVSIISFSPNKFRLAIQTDTAGFLVILQNNFDGWKAITEKGPISIETANATFMGLKIPAGAYTITLSYQPSWFVPGMLLSLVGLVLLVFFLIANRTYRPSVEERI